MKTTAIAQNTSNGMEWKRKVDEAARTLQRAEEVKSDPKLYTAAIKKLKADADDIQDVLSKHNGMIGKKVMEDDEQN